MAGFGKKDWAAVGAVVFLGSAGAFGACIPWITNQKLLSDVKCVVIVAGLTILAFACAYIQQSAIVQDDHGRIEKDRERDVVYFHVLTRLKAVLEETGKQGTKDYENVVEALTLFSSIELHTSQAPSTVRQKLARMLRHSYATFLLTWSFGKVRLLELLEISPSPSTNAREERWREVVKLYEPYGPHVEKVREKAQALAVSALQSVPTAWDKVFLGQSNEFKGLLLSEALFESGRAKISTEPVTYGAIDPSKLPALLKVPTLTVKRNPDAQNKNKEDGSEKH
jgi:hypothetical protein